MTGYDETKKMLNTLRKLNESISTSKILREQEEPTQSSNLQNDILVINDVEVKLMSSDTIDMKLMDDQKNSISNIIDGFRQQVSQIVEFEPGITISPNQIRMDGVLTDEDVSFVFIAGEEGGLYLNADMLKVEQDVMTILDKLSKFEPTFKSAMEPLITQRNNN